MKDTRFTRLINGSRLVGDEELELGAWIMFLPSLQMLFLFNFTEHLNVGVICNLLNFLMQV